MTTVERRAPVRGDIETDPGERKNLKKSAPEKLAEQLAKLAR